MNEQSSFERIVADSVNSIGLPSPSDGAIGRTIERASSRRQRPRLLALIKEPPMRISSSLAVGSPMARVVTVMVATVLITIMVAGAGIAGARLLAAGPIVVDRSGDGTVTTITEAVAMAEDGDTILVRPGTYVEAIVIDRDITLSGDGPREEIVIEALPEPPTSPTESDSSEEDPYALLIRDSDGTLSGLTFRGRDAAVLAIGGAPVLEDLAFEAVGVPCCRDSFHASLVLTGGTTAEVRDSSFDEGHGIRVYELSEPLIEANDFSDGPMIFADVGDGAIIRGNTFSRRDGNAIFYAAPTTASIEANTFEDIGSAINVVEEAAPVIRGNTITRAEIGIWVELGALPSIVDNVLTDNQKGISVEGSSPTIEGNTITDGFVGLSVDGTQSAPLLSGNTICDNETNVAVSSGAEMPDLEGNEICADAPVEASE